MSKQTSTPNYSNQIMHHKDSCELEDTCSKCKRAKTNMIEARYTNSTRSSADWNAVHDDDGKRNLNLRHMNHQHLHRKAQFGHMKHFTYETFVHNKKQGFDPWHPPLFKVLQVPKNSSIVPETIPWSMISPFFLSAPFAFCGSPPEAFSRTSGESNHHRQPVSDTRVPPYQLSHEDTFHGP